jgi:hypothetical protein
MDQLKTHGWKSHDYHIFMGQLLPPMLRGFVKKKIWEALAELSYFLGFFVQKRLIVASC